MLNPPKDISTPPILALETLPDQLVSTNPWQDLRPDNPVDGAGNEERNSHNTVKPVGQTLVDRSVLLGGDKRSDDEVEVCEEEEGCNGEGGFERWGPFLRNTVGAVRLEVEVNEASSDEGVDDGKRVGDEAGIVSLTLSKFR
jgi:hypothetical protein